MGHPLAYLLALDAAQLDNQLSEIAVDEALRMLHTGHLMFDSWNQTA